MNDNKKRCAASGLRRQGIKASRHQGVRRRCGSAVLKLYKLHDPAEAGNNLPLLSVLAAGVIFVFQPYIHQMDLFA